ncbi:Aromatic prenyltransferase Orf2 [Streptomyces sp. YIM 130001]|uniref:aromatic prenyltransferase n=1 Tax=Streptomyces sp. YIM 130001 TaxID=2259644 RepID=UPI000E64F5F3|nr:aromatic prenyltransferase [Streptomyces sp. YIM 130001]RII13457.1 Aromatic prenyltransferase Orf2 [Streptomyces sp. YIM 130001]
MARTGELEALYAAMEESAELLGIAPSREKVLPILEAYQDDLAKLVVAFRVTTRGAEDLDCRFTALPGDVNPYLDAVHKGITPATDHPVGSLLADLEDKMPFLAHGIDFGVVGGFKKTWTFLPMTDLQNLATLIDTPSMPKSLAENIDFYKRYGLDDKLSMIGVDYPSRTVNIYFLGAPAECREPETVRAMLKDLGLPEPSERMLEMAQRAAGIYTTLSWDSPNIHRITFATMVPDFRQLPDELDVAPEIEKFARNVGYTYDATGKGLYNAAGYSGGEYFKLQTYYQLAPGTVEAKGLLGSAA